MNKRKKTLIFIIIALIGCVALTGCVSSSALAERGEGSLSGLTLAPSNEEVVPTSHKISFYTGTDQKIDSVDVVILEKAPVPERNGYTFEGWYLTSNCTGTPVTFPFTPDRDTTLYAKWVSKEAIKITNVDELFAINEEPSKEYVLDADIDLSNFNRYEEKYSDGTFLGYKYDTPHEASDDETDEEAKKYNERHKNSWIPICGGVGEAFSGTFDGNGHSIIGLKIVVTSADQDDQFNYLPIGLFGKVTGTVRNVIIDNAEITIDGDASLFYIGAVAGWVTDGGKINYCNVVATIKNPEIVYESTIWDSLFGSYATPTENTYMGGVVGYVDGATVEGCVSEGSVTSESNADAVYMGGLVGCVSASTDSTTNAVTQEAKVTKSNSTAYVKGRYAGGLVGYNNGAIQSCFAKGNVEGSRSYPAIAGGLVGYNYTLGTISRSYATGKVSARTAGGLVGVNVFDYATADGGTISDAYAGGDVEASEFAGGLVGRAVADMPVNGRAGYSTKVFDPASISDSKTSSSTQSKFYIIQRCLAYGSVKAEAANTTFKDYTGKESTAPVYYPVYAGSVIGQAYELLIQGCVGFGNVYGSSSRPITTTEDGKQSGEAYNPAYADNFVGQSSNSVHGNDYEKVYVSEGVQVTRNNLTVVYDDKEATSETFVSYNNADAVGYDSLNGASFYSGLGFDTGSVWNVSNLDVEKGAYPTLE